MSFPATAPDAFCRLPRPIQFGLTGGGVFVVGLALLYALVDRFHWSKNSANLVMLTVTFALNYALNRLVTWLDRDITRLAVGKFLVSRTATTALNAWLFAWLIRRHYHLHLGPLHWTLVINYLAASSFCIGVVTVINFLTSDRWVFAPAAPRVAVVSSHARTGLVQPDVRRCAPNRSSRRSRLGGDDPSC